MAVLATDGGGGGGGSPSDLLPSWVFRGILYRFRNCKDGAFVSPSKSVLYAFASLGQMRFLTTCEPRLQVSGSGGAMGFTVLGESLHGLNPVVKDGGQSSESYAWFESNSRNHGVSNAGVDFVLNAVQESPYSPKQVLKQAMLHHEVVFRNQVLELHRLYWTQKNLMNDFWRDSDKETMNSTLAQNKSICEECTVPQRGIFNLQVPFIENADTEQMEMQSSLCCDVSDDSDSDELDLTLGNKKQGNYQRKDAGKTTLFNKDGRLSTKDVDNMETSAAFISSDDISVITTFNCQSHATNGAFTPSVHPPAIYTAFTGRTRKEITCRPFVYNPLADHNEMLHEKDSVDLDSGLHEFGDCFPTHGGNQEPEITFNNPRNFDLNMTQFESFTEISHNNVNLSSSESSSTIPSGTLNSPHANTIAHPTSGREADFLHLHGGQASLGKTELPKFSGKNNQEEVNGVDAIGEKLEHTGRKKTFSRTNAEVEGQCVPSMNDNIQANHMTLVVTGNHTGRKEVNTVADGHVLEKSCSCSESTDENLEKDQTLSAEMDSPIFSAAESLIHISSLNTRSTSDKVPDVDQMEVANEERRDGPQKSSDSYESMVLMLTETANDECSMPAWLPEGETGKGKCRFNLRKGRGVCDFRRDVLPGLVSLSRQEICEDLHTISEVVRLHELPHGPKKLSKGNWFTPIRSRRSRVGKRR
ncbi:hypothetical protein Taro_042862 [Colocasia esculenta]|uniref:Uncharacterized protein n=1 Tax=Colocasia esculenta TaxID=4460 RepID=A0A843WZF5_COLES|nr:hypothetical protein [Colocasia esculenta]